MNLYVDEARPCPPGWTPARTINEALEVLATQAVAVVSLDYDIDLVVEVEVPSRRGTKKIRADARSPETWAAVARYLALMPADARPTVQYHTANPAGEAAMRAILEDA